MPAQILPPRHGKTLSHGVARYQPPNPFTFHEIRTTHPCCPHHSRGVGLTATSTRFCLSPISFNLTRSWESGPPLTDFIQISDKFFWRYPRGRRAWNVNARRPEGKRTSVADAGGKSPGRRCSTSEAHGHEKGQWGHGRGGRGKRDKEKRRNNTGRLAARLTAEKLALWQNGA